MSLTIQDDVSSESATTTSRGNRSFGELSQLGQSGMASSTAIPYSDFATDKHLKHSEVRMLPWSWITRGPC